MTEGALPELAEQLTAAGPRGFRFDAVEGAAAWIGDDLRLCLSTA